MSGGATWPRRRGAGGESGHLGHGSSAAAATGGGGAPSKRAQAGPPGDATGLRRGRHTQEGLAPRPGGVIRTLEPGGGGSGAGWLASAAGGGGRLAVIRAGGGVTGALALPPQPSTIDATIPTSVRFIMLIIPHILVLDWLGSRFRPCVLQLRRAVARPRQALEGRAQRSSKRRSHSSLSSLVK